MYEFIYEGKKYQVAIIDSFEDYKQLIIDDYTIYYIKYLRVFVLRGYVIAKGNLRDVYQVGEPFDLHSLIRENEEKRRKSEIERSEVSMKVRRNYDWIKNSQSESLEKKNNFKMELLEVTSAELKTADTGEVVLELSVPSADELDNYFSSIGFNLPEAN